MKYNIYCEDCVSGSKIHLDDNSTDLMICDPPFGINESSFDNHYKRKKSKIIDGYIEAPSDYYEFTYDWLLEANRTLKKNGSLYLISGWTNLNDVLNALNDVGFVIRNHIIWKFNFGVYTKIKYVSSHYHILYAVKYKNAAPTFNKFCRFGPTEKNNNNKSLNYMDLEDVWYIKKEYHQGKRRNKNKLPDELVRKIILYSSNENDVVCDFFMGNFTTAFNAIKLGRIPTGFELNKECYGYFIDDLDKIEFGKDLSELKSVEINMPINQGKRITEDVRESIFNDYNSLIKLLTKKETIIKLGKKYGRGKFSIINIIDGFKNEN